MPDRRFYRVPEPIRLGDLAKLVDATVVGDPDRRMSDVAPLDRAGSDEVSFLDHRRYRAAARLTAAGAVVVRPSDAACLPPGTARLLSGDPYRAFATIARAFHPERAEPGSGGRTGPPEIAATATIDASASVGDGCIVDPGAVVSAAAEIGPRCRIHALAFLGPGVVLGADCEIGRGASLGHCLLGDRVTVHAGARIGEDGFGFAMGREHLKIPQLGRAIIEDDVEIGANTTIDRGSGSDTVIGRGTKIDNLVQIAHNVVLGAGCIVAAQTGIAGSTSVGAGSTIGGQVAIAGHLTIGPGVRLAARTGVTRDLEGHITYAGAPAVPIEDWRRQVVQLRRLGRKRTSS